MKTKIDDCYDSDETTKPSTSSSKNEINILISILES
jgi:hypothetical protein